MAASLGLSAPNVMPREDLVKHIYDAQVNYNELKNNAPQNRGIWLDGLAMARAEAGLESATKVIKVMRQKEKQRKDNRVINRVMKPSTRRPLSMVQTLSATKQVLSHVTQSSIEDAGLSENERRFRQSHSTPLQQPIALEVLGRTGMTEAADEMLRTGKVPPEVAALDPFLEDYLAAHKVIFITFQWS